MESKKQTDEQLRSLIKANQVAIIELGNNINQIKNGVERLWKHIDTVNNGRLNDMQDQWKLISDLTEKVERLDKKQKN